MAKFAYEAYNDTGSLIQGELEAESGDAATARLAAMGYIPVAVRKGGGAAKAGSGEGGLSGLEMALARVKPQDLILFTKQFRTMLAAGLSVLELLRVLEQQTENKKLKAICATMGDDMRKGVSISDALAKHPSVFSRLYVSMVKAGEISGMLPEVLDRLIYIISHENKVKTDIKKALQYPMTVLIALGGAFFFLLAYVVPVFAKMFATAKIELPWPTKVALAMNVALTSYWYVMLGGLVLVAGGLWLFFRTEEGRVARDGFWLKIPILGTLFVKAAMSRFASIFSILQASGVQVLQALEIFVRNHRQRGHLQGIFPHQGHDPRGPGHLGALAAGQVFHAHGGVHGGHRRGDGRPGRHAQGRVRALRRRGGLRRGTAGRRHRPHPHRGSGRGGGIFRPVDLYAHVGNDQDGEIGGKV